MDMLIEADQEYLDDAKRAVEIMEAVAGPLAGSLPIAIGLMSIVHGYTHGRDAMSDWTDRLGKFTAVFPVVDGSADEEDLDWLVRAANEINKGWAAARPAIKTRAIQIVTWSGVLAGLAEAYGDDAVEAFLEMTKGWAAVWDGSAKAN